jgi:hypothetical protein
MGYAMKKHYNKNKLQKPTYFYESSRIFLIYILILMIPVMRHQNPMIIRFYKIKHK